MHLLVALVNHGATTDDVFKLSEDIIVHKTKLRYPVYMDTHIDLSPMLPVGYTSLKMYACRGHAPVIQEIPIEVGIDLDEDQMDTIKRYCINDLNLTEHLTTLLSEKINAITNFSRIFKYNYYSLSDAQISERYFKRVLCTYKYFKKQPLLKKTKLQLSNNITFEGDDLNKLLDKIKNYEFRLTEHGYPVCPSFLKSKVLSFKNGLNIQLGIGGIHSCESARYLKSTDTSTLIDQDVASYYPNILLKCRLSPRQHDMFLSVYDKVVKDRLRVKAEGNKTLDYFYKIVINALAGKFANRYSVFYDPSAYLTMTLSGQLYLLMLIEELLAHNIDVVSTNTDGVLCNVNKNQMDDYERVCTEWQSETKFDLEKTNYKLFFQRDVNNYFALKYDGDVKTKGVFSKGSLAKNPQHEIIHEAIINYIAHGKPVDDTINECNDLYKFVIVRKVSAGCEHNGVYVGKVLRWFYGYDESSYLKDRVRGNKVAMSDGAVLALDFSEHTIDEVNKGRYIKMTKELLEGYEL